MDRCDVEDQRTGCNTDKEGMLHEQALNLISGQVLNL